MDPSDIDIIRHDFETFLRTNYPVQLMGYPGPRSEGLFNETYLTYVNGLPAIEGSEIHLPAALHDIADKTTEWFALNVPKNSVIVWRTRPEFKIMEQDSGYGVHLRMRFHVVSSDRLINLLSRK